MSSSTSGFPVFMSFRGEDTRRTFVSHLLQALTEKNIPFFKEEPLEVIGSIQRLKIAVVVISENYASSRLCLDELKWITEIQRMGSLTIVPVYYGVKPNDVKRQTGKFGEQFLKLHTEDPGKIEEWRLALAKLASIHGEQSENWEDEAELVKEVTGVICKTLSAPNFCGPAKFNCVGIDCHIEAVCGGLMELESDKEIRIVGIWGVGGVGKTTLARCVYEETMPHFHTQVFLENVGKIYQDHGSSHLQEEVLLENIQRSSKNGSDVTKARLRNRKVLLIFDGVDSNEQIEDAQKVATWFGEGSRVIVTMRDENLLVHNGVKHVYEVKCLKVHEALQLFYHVAFKQETPYTRFKQLSVRAALLSGRIPLALEVLASFLRGKTENVWERVLQKLERQQRKDKVKVIQTPIDVGISIDEEEDNHNDEESDDDDDDDDNEFFTPSRKNI